MKLSTEFIKLQKQDREAKLKVLGDRIDKINNDMNVSSIDDKIERSKNNKKKKSYINKNYIDTIQYNRINDELCDVKRQNQKNLKKQIKENSEKIADKILHIKAPYDEVPDADDYDSKNININNIKRVIKVRKIMNRKFNNDSDDDNEHNNEKDINDLKNDELKTRKIQKWGNPCFIKTRFRSSTVQKFKNANGNYFGIFD